ncbi:MAG: rhomboid family intramembrane serine protease [Vulcanimicrobiota bacterium]
MDDLGVQIRRFAAQAPVTTGLIVAQIVTFLALFFGQPQLVGWMITSDALKEPWALFTYPLVNGGPIVGLLLTCFVLGWVLSSLERTWGSGKLGAALLSMTVGQGLCLTLGSYLLEHTGAALVGIPLVLTGMFTMWAMMNPRATVLLFFVIPLEARFLGYLGLIGTWAYYGPALGLFAIICPLAGWYYVTQPQGRGRSQGPGTLQRLDRARRKRRLRAIEGGKKDPPTFAARSAETSTSESRIDAILDKIAKQGLAALSPEEKATLDAHSANLRGDKRDSG